MSPIMIGEVEDARIPSYQPFETLSLVRSQRENERLSTNGVMCFSKDHGDSVPLISEAPKKSPHESKTSKRHGFLSDSSCISMDASESSMSTEVNSSNAPQVSRQVTPVSSAFFTEEMTPEFAFTKYQRRSEDQVCPVCGHPSVGFHHRAYVCEACKKFFTRHLTNRIKKDKSTNGEGCTTKSSSLGSEIYLDLNAVCPMGGNCKIGGPGRGKCPHCRFRKCLDLGMSLTPPGGEIGCDVSKIPCRVCGGPSSGFHFGALTCEGCKGFFRRTVHSNSIPQCLGNQTCRITPSNRNICKSCRFKKCLDVGMSQKRSRVGRQPNAIKYYCMREISHRRQNGELTSSQASPAPNHLSPQTNPIYDVAPHSSSHLQVPLPPPVAGAAKGSLNTMEAVDAMVVPTVAMTSSAEDILMAADYSNSTDGGQTRSRASTLSASSGFSSSSINFQTPLEAQQSCRAVSSASSLSRLKVDDAKTYDTGTGIVDSSYDLQPAPLTGANSFANNLLNPQFAGGNYFSQLFQSQSTATAEFFSQLAKHHPTMVAAAAASLLWGNPSSMPVFEPERPAAAVPPPPQPTTSMGFHPHQPSAHSTLPTVFQPVGMAAHQSDPAVCLPSCLQPPATGAKKDEPVESRRLQFNVGREGYEPTLSLEDGILTNIFSTLAEFSQGIERATDFLRSERVRLKRARNDSRPRFTTSDTIERVWSQMMHQFVSHTRMVVNFSKLIAGFNRLGINDRRRLIRAAMYPIMLVELSRDFHNGGTLSYNYFDFLEYEKDIVIHHFPPFTKMISHLVQFGKVLQRLKLDDTESTIICIQELLRHKDELEDPASCEHLFLLSMQALVNHEQLKFESETASERLTTFTQLLPMLNQLNLEHHEVLSQVRQRYPHLVFPELYVEVFAIGTDNPPYFFQNL